LSAKKIWYFTTPNSEDSVALKNAFLRVKIIFLGHRGLQDKYNIGLFELLKSNCHQIKKITVNYFNTVLIFILEKQLRT
jgi:hypothetical protein